MKFNKRFQLVTVCFLFLVIASVSFASDAFEKKLRLYKQKVEEAAVFLMNNDVATTDKACLDREGQFFFDNQQGYIFIIDTNGYVYVNGAKPVMKNKNLLEMKLKDAKGFIFFEGFINMAKKYGNGWVEYWWPKPNTSKPSVKVSYVKKLTKDGIDYVIGAGLYDIGIGDVYKVFPEEKGKTI